MAIARSTISIWGDKFEGFLPQSDLTFAAARADENTLVVDSTKRFQPIAGFGANLTDTDLYNLERLSPAKQEEALKALFDSEEGAGWSFMRVAFGSTDWERNLDFYTYDDMPEGEKDWELEHFSIQRDIDRGYFDLIKRIKKIRPDLMLLASVWGLPPWMKENDSIMYGRFDPACAKVYARYLRMAVQAWQEQGVELFAVTPQNESLTADDRATPATRFTWQLQRDVLLHMREEFDAHGLTTQIWCFDHNFDMLKYFVEPLLDDPQARKAIDAVAVHHYGGSPVEMARMIEKYPEKPFYLTERTIHRLREMGDLVEQLRNGARSFIHWVFVTDEYGGPHQYRGVPFIYGEEHKASHIREATLIVPLENPDAWSCNVSWGLFGQFSRYLRRGMERVDCTYGHREWVSAVAFRDGADGEIAMVVVNETDEVQSFNIQFGGQAVSAELPPLSVGTWCFTPDDAMKDEHFAVADAPAKVIPVAPTWDLQPTDIWFDEPCESGREIRLRARVRNVGDAPTPKDATIFVQFSLDGDEQIARAYRDCPVLQPGDEVELISNVPYQRKYTWTSEPGTHLIMGVVRMGNAFAEVNVHNNRIGKDFTFR